MNVHANVSFRSSEPVDPVKVDRLLARGWNLPAEFYTDPGIFALEEQVIFRRAWQIVCTERELLNPGDFVTTQLGALPVLVSRDEDGELRAMVNVCRHRGKVVQDEARGNCRAFTCKYHAWSYRLDGSFRGAPSSETLHKDELGLLPLSVGTWKGLVFVAIEPQQDLMDYLGDVPRVMAENGSHFDFSTASGLSFESDLTVDIACNWKAWVENNHECYHCPSVHPTSLNAVFCLGKEEFRTQAFKGGMYLSAPFRPEIAARFGVAFGTPDAQKPDLEQYFIWPNQFVATTAGHADAFFRIDPIGPDACRVVTWTYGKGQKMDEDTRKLIDVAFDEVVQEDIVMSEQTHTGMRSGAYVPGPLIPGREDLLMHFQKVVWEVLGPELRKREAA
jgi:phenylpropionate dioxygenase-like ring-hydroxylating dioxygenase large terminal subunit